MANTSLNIADALFTKTQQRVLGLLYGKSDQSYYRNELIRLSGMGRGTIVRELDRLVASGIVTETRRGNQLHYRANPQSPVFEELRGIIKKTLGLVDALLTSLKPFLAGLELAFIYGSVAKGSEHAGSDIDLMLVGESLNYSEIIGALIPAAEQLGREINPTLLTPKELKERIANKHSFTTRVLDQDKLWLVGENNLTTYLPEKK